MMFYIFLFVTLVAVIPTGAQDVTRKDDCKCFEEYEPQKIPDSDIYSCIGEKTQRIFACGVEKPPICKCEKNGKTVDMDLGVTDCLSLDLQSGRYCQNKGDFDKFFEKYPLYATVD